MLKSKKKYTSSANNKTAEVLPQDSKEKSHNIKDRKDTKPLVNIAGDSIIKDLNGRMMSRKHNVKIHCFSGSTTEDMTDFVKPLLKKNPSHFIFHAGTNDSSFNSPDKIVDSINSLVEIVSSKVLPSKLDWFPSTKEAFWRKNWALMDFQCALKSYVKICNCSSLAIY